MIMTVYVKLKYIINLYILFKYVVFFNNLYLICFTVFYNF